MLPRDRGERYRFRGAPESGERALYPPPVRTTTTIKAIHRHAPGTTWTSARSRMRRNPSIDGLAAFSQALTKFDMRACLYRVS
jgi:hypothetical protein